MNENEVRNVTRKFLDEEHLLGFIKVFEKEHNLFRGSHDKIQLPAALDVPDTIINQINVNSRLDLLNDVSIPEALTTGDFIQYDAVTELWTRQAALTQGQILFPDSSGYFTSDTNLFWDNANNRLGVGLSGPLCLTHIRIGECAAYAGLHPSTALLLEGTSYVALQLQGATNAAANIVFSDDDYNPPAGRIQYNFNAGEFNFTIEGNVLVYFKPAGISSVQNYFKLDSTSYAVFIADAHNSNAYIEFQEDGTIKWTLGFNYSESLKFQICEGLPGTNVRIEIDPGSLINLYLDVGIRNSQDLRFYDNGNYVGFKPPALSADQIWTLPAADGPANEVLGTDGAGTLIWRTWSEIAGYATPADEKVKVDAAATADYLGAASNDGALRVAAPLSYTDGGNFVTIGVDGTVLVDGDFGSAGIMKTDGAGTYSILPGGEDTTDHNFYLGTGAGANLASGGTYNVLIGENAGNDLTTEDFSVYIGYIAGEKCVTGSGKNVFIGCYAGKLNTSGNSNFFLGYNSGGSNTTGVSNVGIGTNSLLYNVGGSSNVAVGKDALNKNTGSSNIGIGLSTGFYTTSGTQNVSIGTYANFRNVTGRDNIAIGYAALYGVSAQSHSYNIMIGQTTGYAITTGSYNTAIGDRCFRFMTIGEKNTGVGHWCLYDTTEGVNNTVIGYKAGEDITTGDGNVCIGYMAGSGQITTENNKLYIMNSNSATPLIYGEFPNTLLQVHAPLHLGQDGARVGALTLWDGPGGNTPGYAKIHSPDGTAWYVFVEDDGTVKVHNGVPTANADGDAIGDQVD